MKISFLFPLLLSSCRKHQPDVVSSALSDIVIVTEAKSPAGQGTADLLTFNHDVLMNLDSYVQTTYKAGHPIEIRSQNGYKTVFACINSQWERHDWANIRSYQSLADIYADLRKEKSGSLLLRGQARTVAGSKTEIHVSPVVSEIYLRSIRCNFTGKSYENEDIRDVRVYLTNVNARCSLLEYEDIIPTHIINSRSLNESDLNEFAEPEMILQEMDKITDRISYPDIRLYCYPNNSKEEGPGTPFTRLIIEGKIGDTRYWWPVIINREDGQEGISCGSQYVYDIVITRKGSESPDTDIDISDMEIKSEIRSWEEKEEYQILF